MLFLPYRLWDAPPVVAYQERHLDALHATLRGLEPRTHLLFHCSGPTGGFMRFFKLLRQIMAGYPRVHLHLIANTAVELACFRRTGAPVAYGPVSLYVDDTVFAPRTVDKCFDAIYVAHFTPGDRNHFKRHLLAASLPSLSIVTNALSNVKRSMPELDGPARRRAFYETYPELRHAEVNDEYVTHVDLPGRFSQARVNLALSAAEGCMLGFTEGLLCGLPGVSTRCDSARTEFFHPGFVRVVDTDADAVAEGVREMIAREIDPEEVRRFTLERQRNMRIRYAKYIAGLTRVRPDVIYRHLFESTGGIHRLAYAPGSLPPAGRPARTPPRPAQGPIHARKRWRGGSAPSIRRI